MLATTQSTLSAALLLEEATADAAGGDTRMSIVAQRFIAYRWGRSAAWRPSMIPRDAISMLSYTRNECPRRTKGKRLEGKFLLPPAHASEHFWCGKGHMFLAIRRVS
jgi:hypothetical protein